MKQFTLLVLLSMALTACDQQSTVENDPQVEKAKAEASEDVQKAQAEAQKEKAEAEAKVDKAKADATTNP